jgi:hypothetical protein
VAYLPPDNILRPPVHGWRQNSLRRMAILAGMCLVGSHLFLTTTSAAYGLLKDNAQIRAALGGYAPDGWRAHLALLYGESRGDVSGSARARLATLASLRQLSQIPRGEKRKTLLYIPKTNRSYWEDLRQTAGTEGTTPFIAPALSGLAMISGEPEYEDLSEARRITYDYWSYPLPNAPANPAASGMEELKARAREMGFRQVIVLQQNAAGCCAMERIQVE